MFKWSLSGLCLSVKGTSATMYMGAYLFKYLINLLNLLRRQHRTRKSVRNSSNVRVKVMNPASPGRLAYSLLAPLTWTSMTFLPQLPQISTSPGNSYSNFETWFLSDFDSYYTWGQARTVNSTLLWNGSTVTHHCVMDLTPPLASQFQCDLLRASIHPLYHECFTFGLSIHLSTWNSFGE